MDEQNLLTEKSWLGTFYLPNSDFKFSGEIIYSPTNGITFNSLIIDKNYKFFKKHFESGNIKVIHGILNNSNKCTLFGNFSKYDFTSYGIEPTTFSGNSRVWRFIIGDEIYEDTGFDQAVFTLTGLDEFFQIENYKKTEYPNQSSNADLKISKDDTYSLKNIHFEDIIYTNNCVISEEINRLKPEALTNKQKSFAIKHNKQKVLILDYFKPVEIEKILQDINQITKLLAFLLFSPVMPIRISINLKKEKGDNILTIYQSSNLDIRTLDLINRNDKCIQEINAESIDFLKITLSWITNNYDYEVLSSIIQNKSGWIDRSGIYGEFLLFASQLESIGKSLGGNKKNKYILPVERFASDFIITKLEKFFIKYEINDIGEGIACLRNDIAHDKKTKHDLLSKLHEQELINLSQVLFTIIISSILINVGVDKKVTDIYQYHLGLQII